MQLQQRLKSSSPWLINTPCWPEEVVQLDELLGTFYWRFKKKIKHFGFIVKSSQMSTVHIEHVFGSFRGGNRRFWLDFTRINYRTTAHCVASAFPERWLLSPCFCRLSRQLSTLCRNTKKLFCSGNKMDHNMIFKPIAKIYRYIDIWMMIKLFIGHI